MSANAASSSSTPATPSRTNPGQGGGNSSNNKNSNPGRARHLANQKKYANPLPIIFNNSPASSSSSSSTKDPKNSILSTYVPSFSISSTNKKNVEIVQCIGTFDPITRSVWIEDERSKDILFTKGFFGKGSLSRSEPSWRERRVALLKGGATLAAEQMREQRRLARKQFKIDRAAAMLDAAKQAEAILTSSVRGGSSTSNTGISSPLSQSLQMNEQEEEEVDEGEGGLDIDNQIRPSSPTPSTSTTATGTTDMNTIIDPMNLTPQTFLVRPTRPDQNRNRGRKAFKRRPPPSQPATAPNEQPTASTTDQLTQPQPPQPAQEEQDDEEEEEEDLFDESLVEEMEHLQLSLEEALFLTLGLGVLKVFDPTSETYIPNGPALLSLLLTPPSTSSITKPLSTPSPLLPDDPLIVSYIAYHHFRSLGWVVKDGIKFCCDWLLYRRGPAFSHSAFACIVIPVYEDPQDKVSSPYGNEDWYEERLTWKWVNTIMRVNALVQKTVIAVYVTIPSLSSFDNKQKLDNGSLDPYKNDFISLLTRYTVREVSLTRFGPSRRRD